MIVRQYFVVTFPCLVENETKQCTMPVADPLECETSRLLPEARAAGASGCWDCQVSWRWVLVLVLSFCTVMTALDHTLLALALSPAFREVEFTTKAAAALAFLYGRMASALAGGRAAQLHGGKPVLLWGVLCWSTLNFVTALSLRAGTSVLVWCRALTGAAEGVMTSCIFQLLSAWFPSHELTRALAVTLCGAEVGTCLTLSLVGSGALEAAWVVHYYVFGTVGVLWCALHWKVTSSTPEWHPQVSLPEVQHITQGRPAPLGLRMKQRTSLRCGVLLQHPALLSVYAVNAIWHFAWHLTVAWLPPFLSRRIEFATTDFELAVALQCAVSISISLAGSWACDTLLQAGCDRRRVRRSATTLGLVVPAVGLQLLRFCTSVPAALTVLVPSIAIFGLAPKCGFLANILDTVPNPHAGVVVAVAEICAALPGILFMHTWRSIRGHLDSPVAESTMSALGSASLVVGALAFHVGCSGDVVVG